MTRLSQKTLTLYLRLLVCHFYQLISQISNRPQQQPYHQNTVIFINPLILAPQMNPFSYINAAIFTALIILSAILIVLLYRWYANRNTQDGYWAKHSQQNSDEESQNNKQQSLIKQQHLNPEIIICDEINCDDNKMSDRKLICGKLLSTTGDDNITVTFGKPKASEPVKRSEDKRPAIMFPTPVIDNFNQSVNVDPQVIYIEDKMDKSCCV